MTPYPISIYLLFTLGADTLSSLTDVRPFGGLNSGLRG